MKERTQYVVVYALTKAGQVPMVLKDKPDFLKGVLNLPGGKVEKGETPHQAAARELREETGIVAWSAPVLVGRIQGNSSDIHVLKIEVRHQPLKPSEGETEKFDWYEGVAVSTRPELMPNLRVVMPLCRSGAIGWTVYDWFGDWRGTWHDVSLLLHEGMPLPLQIRVPGLAYYKEEPCTTQVFS